MIATFAPAAVALLSLCVESAAGSSNTYRRRKCALRKKSIPAAPYQGLFCPKNSICIPFEEETWRSAPQELASGPEQVPDQAVCLATNNGFGMWETVIVLPSLGARRKG